MAAQPNDNPGHGHGHEESNYMAVFYLLAVLTAAEIGVAVTKMPKAIMIVLLVGMALFKAAMVATYFMHLKFERRTLAIIAIIPLVLCTFLLFMLVPDAIAAGLLR